VPDLRHELECRRCNRYPGATLVLNAQQAAQSGDPIQIELRGTMTFSRLRRNRPSQVQSGAARRFPAAIDVRDNLGELQPDLRLVPKREELWILL
jgi:hypothetical protein